MVAPLLLVLGKPTTLALRTVPAGPVRARLVRVMHSRPAAVLVFPPLAAAVDVAGLWALYRTRLFTITHHEPWLRAAVHAHIFAAGMLFTASICQLDPVRRRYAPIEVALAVVIAATWYSASGRALARARRPRAAPV